MAELSSQDAVNQVQSTDASASVDVSASTTDTPTALAANASVHEANDTASKASISDKSADIATYYTELSHAGGEGFTDSELPIHASTFGRNLRSGLNDDNIQGDLRAETRSATGSVGYSAPSEGDFVQSDFSEGISKVGDSAIRHMPKKPSGFKAVSVTKNFLAKAGAPAPQLTKSNLEVTNSTVTPFSNFATSTARPRLVAKTGSAHKLSMSAHLSSGSKTGPSTGPDPMQVWNRNRVQTPQATPKHLTNEELREQYGIQLASIPLGDGDDKGNKWADIDDEEDDWAPEVIEWSDGSKVNLADAEKAAAEKAKAAAEAKKREETSRTSHIASTATPSLGPKATVLKVGAAAQAKADSDSGITSRVADKPTLVAKPVAPALVKSPWATLPPIDKMSPLPVNTSLSTNHSTQNPSNVEAQHVERGNTQWKQAKEIEADDFSRIPRDAPSGVPRELFNSQSGKYEPVSEGRRGSIKRDQNFRPPSVLQRPNLDQDIPATVLRRRDTGEPPTEPITDTQDSNSEQTPEHRLKLDTNQPWRRQIGSRTTSHMQSSSQVSQTHIQHQQGLESGTETSGDLAMPTVPLQPQEDPVTVQKRLMREKRDAAIKRRQEEEAKEEAERRERIKKKLDAMGPPPEKKEKEKTSSPTSPADVSAVLQKSGEDNKLLIGSGDDLARSPPKPPVPTAAGPPQQYGMMKVHPSNMLNGTNNIPSGLLNRPSPNNSDDQASPRKITSLSQTTIDTTAGDHRAGTALTPSTTRDDSGQAERGRWSSNINQASKAWERPSEAQSMVPYTNPWASGSQRTLGNGDFNTYNSQTRSQYRQRQVSPDSILPSPQSVAPPALFYEERNASNTITALQSVGASSKASIDAGAAGPSGHFTTDTQAPNVPPQPPNAQSRTPGLPSPLGHSNSAQFSIHPPQKRFAALPDPRSGVNAWTDFASNVADHDLASRAKAIDDRNKQLPSPQIPTQNSSSRQYNETWKQVTRGEELGSRQVVGTRTATRNKAQNAVSSSVMEDNMRQPPVTMPPQHPRPSRFYNFFGNHEQSHQLAMRQNMPARPTSPPLPPPDSMLHPAFDRTSIRPRVRFPGHEHEGISLRPVVKLPPPKSMPQHPVVAELRGMPPPLRGPAQPLAKTVTWQHRFDGLFNRANDRKLTESIEFSSSKAQFDILSANESAAVNFPQPGQISPVSPSFSLHSLRAVTADEEEALFDGEQDPGSTPPVRVPANKFPADWRPAPLPTGRKTYLSDQDIQSRFEWIVGLENFQGRKVLLAVKLPGVFPTKRLELLANNLRNPKSLVKGLSCQKGRPFPKPHRKPRESMPGQILNASGPNQMKYRSSTSKPANGSPVLNTWAKRVSAGI